VETPALSQASGNESPVLSHGAGACCGAADALTERAELPECSAPSAVAFRQGALSRHRSPSGVDTPTGASDVTRGDDRHCGDHRRELFVVRYAFDDLQ
jgi:hypothetical protein